MGENFEIEVITKKAVPLMIISGFLDAIGIKYTLQDCAEVITNWQHEGSRRIDLDEKAVKREIVNGKIVLINGCAFDKKSLGVILYQNTNYKTYSVSIWLDSSLVNQTTIFSDAVTHAFDVLIPFDVELIAMGVEMSFVYRGNLRDTMKSSVGVLKWYSRQGDCIGRQGDGSFVLINMKKDDEKL